MSFNGSNTVEQMIIDAVENLGLSTAVEPTHAAPAWGNVLKVSRCMPLPESH
jgi:hypothetical protein